MVPTRPTADVRRGLRFPAALAISGLSAAVVLAGCNPIAPAATTTPTGTTTGVTGTATSKTVAASADTYVNSTAPTTAYGTRTFAFGSATVNRGFVRFATPVVPANSKLTSAKLRVWTNSISTTATGVRVHPTTGTWSETTLTAKTRPVADTRVVSGAAVAPKAGSWTEIPLQDLTVVKAGSTTNLEISYSATNVSWQYATREVAGKAPQLVLGYSPVTTTPTPTPTPTTTPTPTPTPTQQPSVTPGPRPFDMSTSITPMSKQKLAFAHYFTPFMIGDSRPASSDYYTTQWLTPNGENGKHAAYGGFLRDRPIPRTPAAGDYLMADMKTDIQQAISSGLDGFTLDILSANPASYNYVRDFKIMDAAAAVNPKFKIMLMPDMYALNTIDNAGMAALIAKMAAKPAAFRLADGRLVVSPFKAEARTAAWWATTLSILKNQYGINVAFVPCFLNLRNNAPAFASISYGFSIWGSRNPLGNSKGAADAQYAHSMGKIWMAPVSVQDERPNQGIYDEAGNTENLRNSWNSAIAGNAEWVQIPTWNDYSEGAQIAPTVKHGWSYLDISAWYTSQWKTGAVPAVVRDTLYVSHRTQPNAALPSYPQTKLMRVRSGGTAPRDTVEVLSVLTAPAKVTVKVGTATYTYDAPAGMSAKLFPLGVGQVSANATRSGAVTTAVTSPFTVTNKPYVQDLQYVAVSSRR